MLTATKPGKCRHCKKRLDKVGERIHLDCVAAWCAANLPKLQAQAAKRREKARKAAEKTERAKDKAKKQSMKTIADLIAEAQRHFNAFIRERDKDKGCFTCGKPFPPNKPGGSIDAGHWITRGHATHLRFNEDNCFGQCKGCNRPGGASRAQLRDGAVRRIGVERADAVENNYEVHKWQRDELMAIAATYRAKLKELKEGNDGKAS